MEMMSIMGMCSLEKKEAWLGGSYARVGKETQSEGWAMDGGGKKKDVEDKLYRLLS